MIKIKTFLLLFLIVINTLLNAQNQYPDFPRNQHSYLGGDKAFFKDFHTILIEKKMKPCENKNEHPYISFLIESSNSVKVLDLEGKKMEENKCTFQLTKEVVKYMDKWIPAKTQGKETIAVKKYFICPDNLFDNYKEGYIDAENTNFDKDIFRKEVVKHIDLSRLKLKEPLKIDTKFRVNISGKIDNIIIEKSSGSKDFDDIIVNAIQIANKELQWKPGIFLGQPVNLYFKMPFSVSPN